MKRVTQYLADYWALTFIIVMVIGFTVALRQLNITQQTFEFHNVHVLQTGDNEFWFVPEQGKAFHTTVCKDYPITFKSGMTLSDVTFKDEGACWSLNPNKHAGYYIERDEHGQPILR